MKKIKLKRISIQYLFFASVIVLVMGLATGCEKNIEEKTQPSQNIDSVLVVWLKPGRTQQELNAWISGITLNLGAVSTQETCLSCDSSLKRLTGPGITVFISTRPARGEVSSMGSPATGEDGPVYYCRDYDLNFNFNSDVIDLFDTLAQPLPAVASYKFPDTKVKVAVFDTGLDTTWLGSPFLYRLTSAPCIPSGDVGWNFAGGNPHTQDDHDIRHGTIVSRFIAEQADNYRGNPVEILTVKTHDKNGMAKLFDILCGFAYAKERGAKIINASFGFYLPRLETVYPGRYSIDPNVRLLREFIKHNLTRNNILLIAAAGNTDEVNEPQAFRDHGLPVPTGISARDLEQVSFYPASLARDPEFPNVIAVTTVDPGRSMVSPNQNFSQFVVDIGVSANEIVRSPDGSLHYVFSNPASADIGASVEGSSFATPIVTGKLCANYHLYRHLIESGSPVDKAAILEIFWTNGIIDRSSPLLVDDIRNGNVMRR